jgi:ATF/CREB family transcription factor
MTIVLTLPPDLRKDTAHDATRGSPSTIESAEPVQPPEPEADVKSSATTTTNGASNAQPLGPPPRPSQPNQTEPDYFNQVHGNNNNGGTYQAEPNPFEAQFGNPSTETPGKSLLPPVSSLTSPQPLLNAGTPGWPSLRSGPLSPAMLTGPTGASDYFDTSFSRGFPTPNESGLRTGLTPGGGGSMFPAPSPNSQALFNSLQSGGATPSTLDFYRTSMASKAANQNTNFGGPTSQPTDPNLQQNMDRSQQQNQPDAYQQQQQQQHADADAVNGLYMLAQANNGIRSNNNNNPYPVASQGPSVQTNMAAMPSQNTSPVVKRAAKNSIGGMSSMSADTAEFSDSGQSEQAKPTTRSRGKKAPGKAATNGRRKADDAPAKAPANKRAKGNNGNINTAMSMDGMDDMSDDDGPQVDANGKKMTDEEKRKNFLERNRYVSIISLPPQLVHRFFSTVALRVMKLAFVFALLLLCKTIEKALFFFGKRQSFMAIDVRVDTLYSSRLANFSSGGFDGSIVLLLFLFPYTDVIQGRCAQVSTAEEAMASQPAGQGRVVQH